MTVECLVSEPGKAPRIFKFLRVPRVGESVTLTDHAEPLVVGSIVHVARPDEDDSGPAIQIFLRVQTH
jgi:hypothetical protein